ncbi:hypothetical protein L1049_028546 [Liquidambar formosana]|uniref:Uncharacterized protein n=1 Tax=Liquidambar formosana TaxID=63359 RepID=A0AAP0WTE3_LIQFO
MMQILEHAYDGLLWTLRSLQELSSLLLLPVLRVEISLTSSLTSKEFDSCWHRIWSCLMHGLPTFSNVTSVADAALMLLGNLISNDLLHTSIVPQDVWDLQLFRRPFCTSFQCYFSRRGSQGDVREILHLRQNLLRAVFGLLNWKESLILNERMVILLPAAIYALCAGYAPFLRCDRGFSMSQSFVDVSEAVEDWVNIEEHKHESLHELFECSVEVLAKIDIRSSVKVSQSQRHQNVRLPRELRDPLLHELETYILVALVDKEIKKMLLPDVFFICALLSNFIYCSHLTRLREERSSFIAKLGQYVLELLDIAVSVIQENLNDIRCRGFLGSNTIFVGMGSIMASFRSVVSCPLFINSGGQNAVDGVLYTEIVQSIERLLKALAKLYEECSECMRTQSEIVQPELSASDSPAQNSCALPGSKSRIMDMELDVSEDSKDVDILAVSGKMATGISFSAVKWKLDMVSLISSFFLVLPVITWEILFDLMEKESEPKVCENILYNLCEHPHWSSSAKLTDMVNSMTNMIKMRVSLKVHCFDILAAIRGLLGTILSLDTVGKDKFIGPSLKEREFGQNLMLLGDLVNKVADSDLLDWFGRAKLIDCICDFVLLESSNCSGND